MRYQASWPGGNKNRGANLNVSAQRGNEYRIMALVCSQQSKRYHISKKHIYLCPWETKHSITIGNQQMLMILKIKSKRFLTLTIHLTTAMLLESWFHPMMRLMMIMIILIFPKSLMQMEIDIHSTKDVSFM